jgi:hypothetical protein
MRSIASFDAESFMFFASMRASSARVRQYCRAFLYRITATANDKRPSAALKMTVIGSPFLVGSGLLNAHRPDLG